MYKLIFAILVCFTISACGQKGPLIVDYSVESTEEIDGELNDDLNANDAVNRVSRQTEGEPTTIYR